jgi:hypothetical protein
VELRGCRGLREGVGVYILERSGEVRLGWRSRVDVGVWCLRG